MNSFLRFRGALVPRATGAQRLRRPGKTFQSLALASCLAAWSASAVAQSAADKATARKLATEGIELHGDGKYAEALDRLERAQALYDAPVHLVYIARSQAKLGLFVESAETYRRLARVELAPNAPAAFREAIDAGKREIGDVEAKIGSLRIDVVPANVPGLKLTIDGQEVSAAVVGVERPANPGRHQIQASAPGYHSAEGSADVAPGGKETLSLELSLDPSAEGAGSAAPNGPGTGAGTSTAPDEEDIRNSRDKRGDDPMGLNVFVGLRVGGAFPGGSLYKAPSDVPEAERRADVATSDYLKTGIMLELNAGAWFAGYFGAKAFIEGGSFAPGPALDALTEFGTRVAANVQNQTIARGFGLSAMVGTPPRRFGAFGEIGVVFAQDISITREFDVDEDPCGSSFEQTLSFSGPGLRFGGAARIPLSEYFQLAPYVLASFGQTNSVKNESKCAALVQSVRWPKGGNVSDAATHHMIIVGVGGDVMFGIR